MKRTVTALVAVALAATALAAPAAAKEMSVALASAPPALGPGEPWHAKLLVHGEPDLLAQAVPGIAIRGPGGEARTFTARPTGKRAADGQLLYAATVVFPAEGRWSYQLLDGLSERAYDGGAVEVGVVPAAAPSAPVEAAAVEDPFPLWPLLAAILVVAVAAAGAIALVRRSRLATR